MRTILIALLAMLACQVNSETLEEHQIQFNEIKDCMFTIEVSVLINGLKMEFEIDENYYSETNQSLYHNNILELASDYVYLMEGDHGLRRAKYHRDEWLSDRDILGALGGMDLNELDEATRDCNEKFLK